MFSLWSVCLSLHSLTLFTLRAPCPIPQTCSNLFTLRPPDLFKQVCSVHLSTSGRGPPTEKPSCLIACFTSILHLTPSIHQFKVCPLTKLLKASVQLHVFNYRWNVSYFKGGAGSKTFRKWKETPPALCFTGTVTKDVKARYLVLLNNSTVLTPTRTTLISG